VLKKLEICSGNTGATHLLWVETNCI